MGSRSKRYINLHRPDASEGNGEKPRWYWRSMALATSCLILCGYLLLPGLYAKEAELRFSSAVLSGVVVALLAAGYSLTVLLCVACPNDQFWAESVFLPALASSAFGLVTIVYNFLASRAYHWCRAAVAGTVVSASSTLLYSLLLLWAYRRLLWPAGESPYRATRWSEPSYYKHYIQNIYPTARSPAAPSPMPLSDDERIALNMALLLNKGDSWPSPDAGSATFKIDLPGQSEEHERLVTGGELMSMSPPIAQPSGNRAWKTARPQSLGERQAWVARDRAADRPHSFGAPSARSHHSRAVSREERRREIELGFVTH